MRKAEEKYLKEFPLLFDKIYHDYSLYRVEPVELYRHFVDGDTKEFLFVVEEGDTLLGYTAFGVRTIGSSTMISIYEMVALTKKGYDMLMAKVEEIGMEKEAAVIDTLAPVNSGLASYLIRTGFLKTKSLATMVHLLDTKRILRLFVEHAVSNQLFNDVTILFCVGKEKIRVKLPEGSIDNDETADVNLVLSANDLLSLLLKKSHCLSLIITGKVTVNPVHKIMSACKVIDYLAEDIKMVIPFTELM